MSDLILFDDPTLPYCGAVRACLAEKNLPFTSKFVQSGTMDEEALYTYSPMGKIPVLLHGLKAICETVAILGYLDEVFPDPPLQPKDPHQRAIMRQVIDWLLTDGAARITLVYEMSRQHVLGLPAGMFLEARARSFQAVLDEFLEGKTWLLGDEISLADLFYMGFMGPSSFVGAEIHTSMKNLMAYRNRLQERPSYAIAHPHLKDWPPFPVIKT